MSIVVFYLDENGKPGASTFSDTELLTALKLGENLRRDGAAHVCISTELANQVGQAGVAAVADGKTPDGQAYDWSKAHRGAGPRKQ